MIGMLKHIESSKERLFILITCLKFDFIFKKYTIYEADISIERTKETDAPAEPTFDYNSELENIKSCFKITDFESYTKFKHTDTLLSSVFNFCERNFKLIELQGFPRFDSKFEEKLYKDLIIEINNERAAWLEEKKALLAKDQKAGKEVTPVLPIDQKIEDKTINYPCYTLSYEANDKEPTICYKPVVKTADFSDFHH